MPFSLKLARSLKGCHSWEHLQKSWRGLGKKQKGDLFEELVKHYLLLEPEYSSKIAKVWLLKQVPTLLAERLKLPPEDKGIDLVAETKEGEYWAIQCKYKQESDQSVTWREISTFTGLAFGVCRGFSFGLIASTTERITKVLKDQDRIGFAALDVWQALDGEFFSRLQARLRHKEEPLKPRLPRPHQKEALKDAVAYFAKNSNTRGKLIMPCGTGKSLTSYFITQKLRARKVLIAVPSLALIRQTLKEWMRESMARSQDVEWICVCSDESAGKVEQDDIAVLTQDLGVPCYTDSPKIADWLKRKHRSLTIVFTTYQSGDVLSKAAKRAGFSFDLGIMDEAHKTTGAKDRLFSHLLHEKNIRIKKRLFMTATERRYRGESDEILSMDDPEDYGETIHKLSFKRALEYRPPILCDYKVVTIHISKGEIEDLVRNRAFVRPKGWRKELEAEGLAALVALRKAVKKYPIRHAVSFHSSIRRSKAFMDYNKAFEKSFPNETGLEAFHVSGETPTGTRARIISDFSNSPRSLITNARCLTEGVDVPNIDAVLFADPKNSLVDIVQATGRALRPSQKKAFGFVILPVVHKAGLTLEQISDKTSFKSVLTTLRALASQDERVIEYFRSISRSGSRRTRAGFKFDTNGITPEKVNLKHFSDSIRLKIWERLAKIAWRPFNEARSFVIKLGLKGAEEWNLYCAGKLTCKPPKPADIPSNPWMTYKKSGWSNLGDWLGTGREATQLREYLPFAEARNFVRGLNFKSQSEYFNYIKDFSGKPFKNGLHLPGAPHFVYQNRGWVSWGDWLGTGTIAPHLMSFRSFRNARIFARGLCLKRQNDWFAFCKKKRKGVPLKPKDIPQSPNRAYAGKGWISWGDWLGTGFVCYAEKKWRPFRIARAFARSLKLKGQLEWAAYVQGAYKNKPPLPTDIPKSPNVAYKKRGWIRFGDWLGTGSIATRERVFWPFKKARSYVRGLNIRSEADWRRRLKIPNGRKGCIPREIPRNPEKVYINAGYSGRGDWFGTGRTADHLRKYRPFKAARAYARSLGLRGQIEWIQFARKRRANGMKYLPEDIPSNPHNTYKNKGWKNLRDWLGTPKPKQKRNYLPFIKARALVRKLKLRSASEWFEYSARGIRGKPPRPKNIPSVPNIVYAGEGWRGWLDFLGKKGKFNCQ